jgi:hypothetical protein
MRGALEQEASGEEKKGEGGVPRRRGFFLRFTLFAGALFLTRANILEQKSGGRSILVALAHLPARLFGSGSGASASLRVTAGWCATWVLVNPCAVVGLHENGWAFFASIHPPPFSPVRLLYRHVR